MKIGILSGYVHPAKPGVYGSESAYITLARGLEKLGHNVTFFGAQGSEPVGRFFPLTHKNDASINFAIELEPWLLYIKELLDSNFIIDAAPNCLITECFTGLLFRNQIRLWDSKNSISLGYFEPHLLDSTNHSYKYDGKLLWSINGNQCIFPSPLTRTLFHGILLSTVQMKIAEETGWDMSRLHLVHYGIDTDLFKPIPNPTADYFLFHSRPHKDKGIFEFLDMARRFPNEVFIMAFDAVSSDHKYYASIAIEQAQRISNVRYVPLNGSLEKKIELYQNAKALIVPLDPSYIEIMGLVFMESLACGTPVITATHGGQVDLITPETGFLCTNQEEYDNAIRSIDKLDRNKCRQLIEGNFTAEHWAKRYLSVYDKI